MNHAVLNSISVNLASKFGNSLANLAGWRDYFFDDSTDRGVHHPREFGNYWQLYNGYSICQSEVSFLALCSVTRLASFCEFTTRFCPAEQRSVRVCRGGPLSPSFIIPCMRWRPLDCEHLCFLVNLAENLSTSGQICNHGSKDVCH